MAVFSLTSVSVIGFTLRNTIFRSQN